jgi:hypothetical protein
VVVVVVVVVMSMTTVIGAAGVRLRDRRMFHRTHPSSPSGP